MRSKLTKGDFSFIKKQTEIFDKLTTDFSTKSAISVSEHELARKDLQDLDQYTYGEVSADSLL